MVVCSSIAFSCVNDKIGDINQGDLVELCIESERRVGVHGGGYVFILPNEYYILTIFALLLYQDGSKHISILNSIVGIVYFFLS